MSLRPDGTPNQLLMNLLILVSIAYTVVKHFALSSAFLRLRSEVSLMLFNPESTQTCLVNDFAADRKLVFELALPDELIQLQD